MMIDRIDAVKRALEFNDPPYLPMELVDVPGIYNAYGTLDPDSVEFIEGTEDFDAAWATYHWTFAPLGENEAGEPLRRDEWGCVQRVPNDEGSAYEVVEKPLAGGASLDTLKRYPFPDPSVADAFFERIESAIKTRYPDRFISAYIDPGPFLVAFNLMGYDGLLMQLADDVRVVEYLIDRIQEYQKELVRRWKRAGAHMVTFIDEFAGTNGLMFSPGLWREHFRARLEGILRFAKDQGLYVGLLLDGDIRAILEDLVALGIDSMQFVQSNVVGVDVIAKTCRGRTCIRASADMMSTLATGTPDEVRAECRTLYENFSTPHGGFIATVLQWHRPRYPRENVLASVNAFREYR